MNIIKKDNLAPFTENKVNFNQTLLDLKHFTNKAIDRKQVNFKLLNKEKIYTKQFTYFIK